MNQRLDHIAIAVKDLDSVLAQYKELFGLEPAQVMEIGEVKLRMALVQVGDIQLHFMSPLEPGAGPVGEFLEAHGEGFHHAGLQVSDLDETMAKFRELDMPVKDKVPRKAPGGRRVVFSDPAHTQHVLFELFDIKGQR